jgi:tetratricopeptide (TPR) repeat protein
MTFWDGLSGVTRSVLRDSMSGPPLVETMARTQIERARGKLRLGNQAAGDALLRATLRQLKELVLASPAAASQATVNLLRGVANSVSGQGLERRGLRDKAIKRYAKAVRLLGQVPDSILTARYRSDYGAALAALGRDREAREHLERARAEDGQTGEATRHLARLLLDHGEHNRAERLIRESLQVVPADPDAYALLGRAQAERRQPAAASTYEQAAVLYLQRGRPADALEALDRVVEVVGENQAVLALRVESLRQAGRADEALGAVERALGADPDNPWLLGRHGALLVTLGSTEQGWSLLTTATRLSPLDMSTMVLASEVALASGDPARALDYARKAAALDPHEPQVALLQATAERRLGDTAAALTTVRAGRATAPEDVELLRLHAELVRQSGDLTGAVELYRWLCTHDSTADDHADYAELLAEAGQLAEALAAAGDAAEVWRDAASLLEVKGHLQWRAGRIEESVETLRHAVELAPDSTRGQLYLAQSLADLTVADGVPADPDYVEAMAALDRSVALAPDSAAPHYLRADLLTRRGEFDDAESELVTALDLEPDHRGALALLADLRLEVGAAGAEQPARRLLQLAPREPNYLYLLAAALYQQQRFEEAYQVVATVPKALEPGSDFHTSWLLLRGEVLAGLQRWDDADADIAAVLDRDPELVDVWYLRAELARRRGAAALARAHAERALALEPDHVPAQGTLAAAHMILGELGAAREILDRTLAHEPDYAFGHMLRAQVAAAEDRPDEARAHLERAVALDPENSQYQLERGWLELAVDRPEAALDIFTSPTAGSGVEPLAGRSEALRLLGRGDDAIAAASEALALSPDDPQALRSLGFALLETEQTDRAVDTFLRLRALYPDDVRVQVDLAHALATAERLDDALPLLDSACLQAPGDTWALCRLAQTLLDIGHFDGAARLYRRALEIEHRDVASWDGLGWALQYSDPPQLADAESAYRTSLQLKADSPWVRKGIANILHLAGRTAEAAALYREVLAEAEAQRSERPYMLELIGWCAFRLGKMTTASRAYYEVVSTKQSAGSHSFDLALVLFCAGRSRRAEAIYRQTVGLEDRHVLRRRGLLLVARADFAQALRDHPELAGEPEAASITSMIDTALAQLPPLPHVAALDDGR